jgi:two-component system NtrC family sensor kinase
VENKSTTPTQEDRKPIDISLDIEILNTLTSTSTPNFNINPNQKCKYHLKQENNNIVFYIDDEKTLSLPFHKKNALTLLNTIHGLHFKKTAPELLFEPFSKSFLGIQKKIFSSNQKDIWDDLLKLIHSISHRSYTLTSLIENLLELPFLKNFSSILFYLHLKGQSKATILGLQWRSEKHLSLIEVKEFNSLFNIVKKAKLKSFSAEYYPEISFPFNGHFLAHELTSQKYNLIATASRNDFLSCSADEIELFKTCINLLQTHFQKLIEQEFLDNQISELRCCIKDFPIPLRLQDIRTESFFLNDLYHADLQNKDIFFSKTKDQDFKIDLYDSFDLQHYAFDLFHFQRISLLGELLNTLRHELSNPLFGLKLGMELYSSFENSADNLEICSEINNNISRCQSIIENFSHLYQAEQAISPVAVEKIISETLTICKSEIRDIKVSVEYQETLSQTQLNHPIIFMVQILFNLIINASQSIKSQDKRGVIKIEIHEHDKNIFFDITDNGPGIDEKNAKLLFKPFYTTKSNGTGLGLILSRNLAFKMGGQLEFLSNHNRDGATFRLTLPLT